MSSNHDHQHALGLSTFKLFDMEKLSSQVQPALLGCLVNLYQHQPLPSSPSIYFQQL